MTNDQRKKIVKVEQLETFAEIIDTLYGSPMGASGQDHAPGQVPDPGATAGTSKYLREDGTWVTPPNFSGSYTDLTDKPTIPDAQIQSDWNQTNTSSKDYIKNKPSSMPASDVSAWAKTANKPSYNLDEVSDGSTRKLADKIGKTINTTWSALKTLRDGSQLVPGQWYRITDYQCTTTQENTQSAGHQFDIIVRADSTDTLNENAYAAHHAGDTYFANSKLEAWRLLYCLDNDTSRFMWAGGKSITISNKNYYRDKAIDVIGATYPYCWSSNGNKRYTASETPSTGDNAYSKSTGGTSYTISSINEETGKGVIYKMVDEADNDCPYDFKNIQFKVGAKEKAGTVANVFYYTFSVASGTNDATVMDHSLNGFRCYNNRIWKWITSDSTRKLNFNVFRNTSTTSFCYSNTFVNDCQSNTFGNKCYNNTFGNDCAYNTFGNDCDYNTFVGGCDGNTFGNNCQSNTFVNSSGNTFNNNCYNNTFNNNCCNNTFGDGSSGNTFSNSSGYNTFKNNCCANTFGNNCYNNTFGDGCQSNTFVNDCQSNTFGNGCHHNTFLKDYSYYIIIENGNRYINITSTQTTSSSNKLQNITVAQGVNNTTTTKTISHNTVNDTFQTIYKPVNSVEVSV